MKWESRGFGFSLAFAERDIMLVKEIRVLEKRAVDADRIVFRVCRTSTSFGLDSDIRVLDEVMAVKRGDRWYLFYVIGFLNWGFRATPFESGSEEVNLRDSSENSTVMDVLKPVDDNSLPENADFKKDFHVPFELIHQEMIATAKHPAVAECQKIQEQAERRLQVLEQRLLRLDFTEPEKLDAAKKSLDDSLRTTVNVFQRVIDLANQRLGQHLANMSPTDTKPPAHD